MDKFLFSFKSRTSSIPEQDEDSNTKEPGKLNVDVDFPYSYDEALNPTLLVPNNGRTRPKRSFFKVEFDQTSTHHAEELGILLPKDFDMA
jgi:hypothetical protein